MIVVTQGHEKGVGLEVFFKALALAPNRWTQKCILFAHKKTAREHLTKLSLPHTITDYGVELPTGQLSCHWLPNSKLPASTVAMQEAFEVIEDGQHVLFTLPTTKDALRNPRKVTQKFLGHTEYLRAHYKTPELGMFFSASTLDVLLLTDHVPLNKVSAALTPKLFQSKLTTSLKQLRKIEPHLKRALVAGLNPHAGEAGLLGKEETRLAKSLANTRVKGFKVEGFFPGDSLMYQKQSSADLLVYLHHDQGLAPFKSLMGTVGANITLGLPYVRLSVDHGTAFSLYGKNMADPRGALYCLRKAIRYQELVSGKNSNQQGQGTQP